MLLALTFLTGVAIGMYVYIAAFKPMYAPETLNDTEAGASEWSLVSRRYGGDLLPGYSQSTFRLLKDGNYTYLPGGADSASVETKEGKLSSSLMRKVRSYDDSLMEYSYDVSRNDCASYVDGYDYEYRITKNNILFHLDTCQTSLGDDSSFALLLREVWDEIEGRGSVAPSGNFSDWAEAWIRKNIGSD